MESNSFKSELKYILSVVNDMLKFAESKHNGLVVFDIGFIIGILTNYSSLDPILSKPVMEFALISFCFSLFMSFISIAPVTRKTFRVRKVIKNPNLYFYGDLATLDFDSFINDFKIEGKMLDPDNMDIDLINQILAISRIAKVKFELFKIAAFSALAGIVITGVFTIIENM
jgi:hypothetical protein